MDGGIDDGRRAGPGDRLRTAREKRGLAVRDVTTRLKLDTAVIVALEADDFAALPAPIFVKGYLNAYCRLLNLPTAECIAEYERAVDGAAPPPLVIRRGTGDGIESSPSRVVVLVLLLFLLLAALAVSWWFARPVLAPATTAVAEGPVVVSTPLPQPEVEPQAELVTAAPPVDEPVAAPVPTTTVRLVFREDSWTEVTDAHGERLYFDLARAGATVERAGEPPIAVFLGNAPGVEVVVDGRPFDLRPYTRSGNVARFTLRGGRS